MLFPSATEARIAHRPVNHYIRQTRLPGAVPGAYRSGLWILNPKDGRVRLCVVADKAAKADDVLQCSAWAGGGAAQGRYQISDIRGQLPTAGNRRIWGVIGVWILNYQTGQVRACLIQNFNQPAKSLRCSPLR